jgi:ABC-type lipoprotein export system ATPase subunit
MDSRIPFLKVASLYKSYDNGLVPALHGISFMLEKGKIYALTGSSGCGKSTLLNLIGMLDKPDSGEIFYEGKPFSDFKDPGAFRRDYLGFVFQFHYLIPVLTLRENVETALLAGGKLNRYQRERKASRLLEEMGLAHKIDTRASKVSGGERQRAAIARALANDPLLILADEPTGNVDSETSEMILKKMRDYVDKTGATMLIATHDPQVAAYADTTLKMKDGRIELPQRSK